MQFIRKNSVGDSNYFDAQGYNIKLFRSAAKPHKATLAVSKNVPFELFDEITAIDEGGNIPFRGYVSRLSSAVGTIGSRMIECTSIETALSHRHMPVFSFPPETTYSKAFAHNAPTQGAGWTAWGAGLLWGGQSALPVSAPVFHYQEPYGGLNINYTEFPGWGTKSRIGDKDIYLWCQKILEQPNKASIRFTTLPDGPEFYRDEAGMYIAAGGDYKGAVGQTYLLAADMGFDYGIRLRNIDNSDSLIGYYLRTDYEDTWSLITGLAEELGLYIHIWYDPDGKTYLDILASPGRGSSDGVFEFYEEDINVEGLSPSLQRVSALTALGIGEMQSRHVYTACNPAYKGIWIEDIYNISNGFCDDAGDMEAVTEARFAARNADLGYRIKLPRSSQLPRPTDFIGIIDKFGDKEVLEVKTITYSSSNPYVLVDVGLTPDDLVDAFQSPDDVLAVFQNELPYFCSNVYTDTDVMTIGDSTHACTPYHHQVQMDSKYNQKHPRVLMSFSYNIPSAIEYYGLTHRLYGKAYVSINGKTQNCYIGGGSYKVGDPVVYADVTDYMKLDATNEDIYFYVKLYGVCTPLPQVDVTMSLTVVWRD